MCNALYHRAGCTCGFGGEGHLGRGGGGGYSSAAIPAYSWGSSRLSRDPDRPNAKCPVCGASVFFFRPEQGGSLWSDDPGPPWTKHPCMMTEENRSSWPVPLSMPEVRDPVPTPVGWVSQAVQLTISEDSFWLCKAALFDGVQVAMPVAPPKALSQLFLRWDDRQRLFGELQFLYEDEEDVFLYEIRVCSYRVIARARQPHARAAADSDWQMLISWVCALDELEPEVYQDLVGSIRRKVEPLEPNWSRRPDLAKSVKQVIDVECWRFRCSNATSIFRWMQLFLG